MRLAAVFSILWSYWFQATPQPVVNAVLFYSPGCSYCQAVMERVFPPLEAKYGPRLQILKVALSSIEDIDRLYASAAVYNLKKEDIMVPFLVIGSQALIGEQVIESSFSTLIEQGLAQGGIPAPRLPPPLAEAAAWQVSATPTARPAGATGLEIGPQPAGAVTVTVPGCGQQGGCSPANFPTLAAVGMPARPPDSGSLILFGGAGLAGLLIIAGGIWYWFANRAPAEDDEPDN